jgi:hypothetical protein
MRTIVSSAAIAILATLNVHADAGSPRPEFQAMSFLAGQCWEGAFPGAGATDRHCFTWVYGGKFLRDRHVLHQGADQPDAEGETIYLWDFKAHQLQYLYIESDGGYLRGTVASEGSTLKFPESIYVDDDGTEQKMRSQWKRSGEDAYDVLTEFRKGEAWQPAFRVHMKRVGPAT